MTGLCSDDAGAPVPGQVKARCREALEALHAYLDGELEAADADDLRRHLDDCRPCLEEYEVDRLLKALVRRSCLQEHAPDALRLQILARISQTTSVSWVRGGYAATSHATVVELRGLPGDGPDRGPLGGRGAPRL